MNITSVPGDTCSKRFIMRFFKILKVLRVLRVLKVRQTCLYPYLSFRPVVFVLYDRKVLKHIVSRSGEILTIPAVRA